MKILFPLFLCLSMTFVSADTSIAVLDDSLTASELKQFRNNAMDILDNPYCRIRFKSYLKLKQPKAFIYVPRSKERTAYCTHVARKTTIEDAEIIVLDRCEKKKKKSKKNKFTSPCRLLARNHTLLQSRSDFGLKSQTKDLYYVAERYGVDEVSKIIETGQNINQRNKIGLTPLHIAVEEDNLEIVKYLISKGADLKLKNNDGDDALIIATKKGLHKIFVHLLSQGADISTTSSKTKRQPIHIAARYGDIGILDAILDKGVDVNQETVYKEVPLHLAIKSLYIPSVKYLIEKGADINAKDKSGKTPLDIARKTRSKRIIDFLIKNAAKSADEL